MVRTYKVQRYRNAPEAGGQTLLSASASGAAAVGHRWFKPGEVPEFEGDEAWFEIDRKRGGCRFIHQVERPSWPR